MIDLDLDSIAVATDLERSRGSDVATLAGNEWHPTDSSYLIGGWGDGSDTGLGNGYGTGDGRSGL